jgi:methionyl-tRNA synthetase
VNPVEVAGAYGVDQFRFFLFREVPFGLDGDFSREAIVTRINGDLANDFGNLVSRSVTMIGRFLQGRVEEPAESGGTDGHLLEHVQKFVTEYKKEMDRFAFYRALSAVFDIVALLNKYVDTEAPWKLSKENPLRLRTVLYNIWNGVRVCTFLLHPFMPTKTSEIWSGLGIKRSIDSTFLEEETSFYLPGDLALIGRIPPVFPRIEA